MKPLSARLPNTPNRLPLPASLVSRAGFAVHRDREIDGLRSLAYVQIQMRRTGRFKTRGASGCGADAAGCDRRRCWHYRVGTGGNAADQ